MTRIDGRKFDELRPVTIDAGFVDYAEGSVLITCGHTKVLCCASVEAGAPRHVPEGTGWVTAEYSMLPRANRERSRRDISKLKLSPRSAEIQRLVGRSLRAAVDMNKLGEHTITIDCDVLQGDGGTRTASVTGGFVALALACRKLVEEGVLPPGYDFAAHRELVPMQPGDVPATYADTSALERDFGFRPSTRLEDGLREFARWYRSYCGGRA